MQVNLQTAAFHFGRSLGEDFLLLFRTLGGNPRGAAGGLSGELVSRIQKWESDANNPDLLEKIFHVYGTGETRIVREFDRLKFVASQDSTVPRPPFDDPSDWVRISVEREYDIMLRNDLEGFVLPLDEGMTAPGDEEYLFVRISRADLVEHVIPRLASATLNAGGSMDYDFCIVTRNIPPRVLFSTLSDRGNIPPGEEDIQTGLLMLPPMPLDIAPMPRREGGPEGTDRRLEEWGRLPGRGGPPNSARFNSRGRGPDRERDGGPPKGRSPLELRVRHRAGSLEAAVNQSRLRNLAISLGILLLMGVAVAVLLVSSYRAQHLAEQQIAFVAGVSHDLRTPLAVMQSVGENLADGVVTEPGRVKAYGQLIRTEVHRLTILAENALAYAGIRAGKQRYALTPVAIADVVTKALSGCHAMMMEAGVRADLHQKDPSLVVQADAGALVTALQDIIMNAVKYRGESRHVDITVEETKGQQGREVCLTVRDYGIGVDARDLAHIFEPFYRGKTARDRQIRGSGLGLHLAQHVISAHGGTIAVQSRVGEGSQFSIHIPLHSLASAPA